MSRAVAGTVVLLLFVASVAATPALASPPQNGLQTPGGFESGETALYGEFIEDAGPLTQYGTNETGREMDARNLKRSAVADATVTQAAESGGGLWQLVALLLVVALGAVAVAAWRSGAAAAVLDSGDDADGSDGATAAPPATDSEPTVSETELLSDSDQVVKLIEENGGRMKQVDIVETTDWSKSKVSMLLSDMEEDGEISKLRVGRENIVSLAGQEPDAAGSPFDEE